MFDAPFQIGGHAVFIGASIGIAMHDDSDEPAEMLTHADVAMYVAKRAGRGRWVTFEAAMGQAAVTRAALETEMRTALDLGHPEFVVHYQPIVELRRRRVDSVEALVRWCHPTRGVLEPSDF